MKTTEVKKQFSKIDPTMEERYKDKVLFKEKYEWAKEYVKGRDLKKEIEEALAKEAKIKPV